MKNTLILTLVLNLCLGCNSNNSYRDVQISQVDSLTYSDPDTNKIIQTHVDYSDSINYIDINGLKQGQWIKKWRGKLVEMYTYVNDTLHGRCETDHTEGFYKNGKKDGFQYAYYGKKESILGVSYYEDGVHIWSGFPRAGRDYFIPPKAFYIEQDSVNIKAHYINGKVWYEGQFCLLPDSLNNNKLLTFSYGKHTVYHMNGAVKGFIDYSNETIKAYDTTGQFIYEASFSEFDVHRQPTLGRYVK